MIKANVERNNGEITVDVEFEGSMKEILTDTTVLVRGIAKNMERQKPGYGIAYLNGLRMGMALGLFRLDLQAETEAGSCPKGSEGEPGVAGG